MNPRRSIWKLAVQMRWNGFSQRVLSSSILQPTGGDHPSPLRALRGGLGTGLWTRLMHPKRASKMVGPK